MREVQVRDYQTRPKKNKLETKRHVCGHLAKYKTPGKNILVCPYCTYSASIASATAIVLLAFVYRNNSANQEVIEWW